MRVLITYSNGNTCVEDGWTDAMIERLRAMWAMNRDPCSTATIEIIGEDGGKDGGETLR